MLRSTLCEVSMEILDYRIESKLIAHYSFPGSGDGDEALSDGDARWIRLVGKAASRAWRG